MENKKSCFIVTPIGGDNTDIRRAAEGIIDAFIQPVLEDMDFTVSVAHRMSSPGSINKQIITRILNDDLVIVNLTGLNPNVMYELAVRHAVRKPIVQICEKGTRLPFDINDERTIFYTNDMYGLVEIKDSFVHMVKDALNDIEPDNPIYRATQETSILKAVEEQDPEKFDIIKRMDELEVKLLSKINNVLDDNITKPKSGLRRIREKESYILYVQLNDPDLNLNFLMKNILEQSPYDIGFRINSSAIEGTDAGIQVIMPKDIGVHYLIDRIAEKSEGKVVVVEAIQL